MMGDLGKLIVAKGFKKLPKVQKIARSGHTARKYHLCLQKYIKGLFTLAFLPQQKRWRFGHSFYVCRHGCI